MSEHDWYRNKAWNEKIEAEFFKKLNRARHKHQYLRIQACTLASLQPEITLRLLEEYFKLGEDFDNAQAYVDQATAYIALYKIEQAIGAYENALKREEAFPNSKTSAYLELPFLIAMNKLQNRYPQALEILNRNHSRLMFPVDFFKSHAVQALILSITGKSTEAKQHALKALEAAQKEKSGFRFHPKIGLVGKQYDSLRKALNAVAK